jgi:hypothetical protein
VYTPVPPDAVYVAGVIAVPTTAEIVAGPVIVKASADDGDADISEVKTTKLSSNEILFRIFTPTLHKTLRVEFYLISVAHVRLGL